MTIFPIPKSLTLTEGTCPVDAPVTVVTDPALKTEEYKIIITAEGVEITSSTDVGAFRAKTTLKQIVGQNPDALPCLTLHDWPDYDNRGLYHHVGGRIPTMKAMKEQLDIMADMKINHVQLELGPYNYNFPSFPDMHNGQNPFTADELKELYAYAKERFIDLVPVMQTFGHVNGWLANPRFRELAECPDGYDMWGSHQNPGTLNPLDPRSQQLAREWLDDVLPVFAESGLFNIGCDETWELGQGKSKEECERLGKTRVFLNFVLQTIDYLRQHGVKPLFWADIILQGSQEVLNDMPKDSVALNWGYERSEVSEDSCIRLEKTGVPYWNAPGTSVWNSLLGQSYKAVQNIARCAVLGKRHGASGLLNTDWEDNNLHHFSPSYFGVAYGAAMGWTVAESDWVPLEPYEGKDDLHAIIEPDAAQIVKISPTVAACFDFLNRFVFMDKREKMAQIAYDAGLYGHISTHKGIGNAATLHRILVQDKTSTNTHGYDAKDFKDTRDYLNVISYRLAHETRMECRDAQWILDEYMDSINMLLYACDLGLSHVGDLEGQTPEAFAHSMNTRKDEILREHDRVWQLRNRERKNGAARYFRQFEK